MMKNFQTRLFPSLSKRFFLSSIATEQLSYTNLNRQCSRQFSSSNSAWPSKAEMKYQLLSTMKMLGLLFGAGSVYLIYMEGFIGYTDFLWFFFFGGRGSAVKPEKVYKRKKQPVADDESK
jgi:hypothetical protein